MAAEETMIRLPRPLFVLLLLIVAGCAPPPQAGALHGPLPPPSPGTARLIFYRPIVYYGPMQWRMVYLNGSPAGMSQPGAVFYRDVAPGRYDLTMQTEGYYPGQFKTVTARAGETFYVDIDTLPRPACNRGGVLVECDNATFIMTIVDPARGFAAIQGLRLISG
jgi:Protein of unknown function (DUF2846)